MTPAMEILTVKVPFTVRRRSGRKLVLGPDDNMTDHGWARIDRALVKALARAFWWRALLETGIYGTFAEQAAAEKINESCVGRISRLTLLAPDPLEVYWPGGSLKTHPESLDFS